MRSFSLQIKSDRLGREFLALVALALFFTGSLTFLRSNAGRRIFVDRATAVDLGALAAGATEGGEGGLTVPGSGDSASRGAPLVVRLGALRLEPATPYLLVARSGAAGFFTLEFTHRASGKRRLIRFLPQSVEGEQQRAFEVAWSAGPAIWRLTYGGRVDLRIDQLTLYRLSRLHGWLLRALPLLTGLLVVVFFARHRTRLRSALRQSGSVDDLVLAGSTFALCLVIFIQADVVQIQDARYQSAVTHRLIHAGTSDLGEIFSRLEPDNLPRQLQSVDGRTRHVYPVAPALLDAPFVAAYEMFGISPVSSAGVFNRRHEVRILRFNAAFLAALLCVLFYFLARQTLAPGHALLLVLVFAFGSQVFSTISRPYWSHAWAVLLSAVAVWAILWPGRREALWAALAATCISWSFFCRPTMALSVIGLTVLALMRCRGKVRWVYVGVGLGWAGLFAVRSLNVFGTWLPPYFFSRQVEVGHFNLEGMASPLLLTESLGALASPGRGLFVYVPFVAWILFMVVRHWRRLDSRSLALVCLGMVVAHLLLITLTHAWSGGRSFGSRQFSDVLVWLLLLGALAAQAVIGALRESGKWSRAVNLGVLAVVVAASLFVNIRGATARATIAWNPSDRPADWEVAGTEPPIAPGRMWNWRYPQFMAGLLPLDREEKLGGSGRGE